MSAAQPANKPPTVSTEATHDFQLFIFTPGSPANYLSSVGFASLGRPRFALELEFSTGWAPARPTSPSNAETVPASTGPVLPQSLPLMAAVLRRMQQVLLGTATFVSL
jgi:hypothetical protein